MVLRLMLLVLLFVAPQSAWALQGNGALCVCIVTKNSDSVLRSCLESIKDVADCLCICDEGSTDYTLLAVEEFIQKTGIPAKIFKNQNIRQSKILAFHAGQKTLNEFGVSLAASYILLLEPDMVLKVGSTFHRENFGEDAYLIFENTPSLSYCTYSPRLLRASLSLESTDDKLGMKKFTHNAKLHSLMIEEQQENSYYTIDKLKLRAQHLSEQKPDNARRLLDLAQVYKGLQKYEEALQIYQSLNEKMASPEELWFAKYMTAECYQELHDWERALAAYMDAYQYDSQRPEPLHKIASYYRQQGQNDLAYLFAKQGSRLSPRREGELLPSPLLHPYQFDEEISIAAYYTPFKEEGFLAGNDLLLRKHVPKHIKEQTYQNILFYVENLKQAQFLPITPELPLVQEGSDEHYHPMNPSIQKTESGYEFICRAVNYTQTGANYFHTIDKEGIFRTRNFLLHFDKNFTLLGQQEIVENLTRERIPGCMVQGLEDCRLFQMDGGLWFTCTTSDTNFTGTRQISLCKLENRPRGKEIHVEKLIPLLGPDPYRCEKNWLPFVQDGHFYTIYSYDPFLIHEPNIATGECEPILSYEPVHDFSHLRGSAGPVEFENGYLLLVHEVVFRDHARYYLHRFLQLDKNFIVHKASKPFTFRHLGVEYCCSMTLDHSGKKLILPIGVEDREAYLCFLDLSAIKSLMRPLPAITEMAFEP